MTSHTPEAREGARLASLAMTRFAAGDKLAFNVVYDFVAPKLAAFAGRRVRNGAFAEDLVQQTFVRMIHFSKTFLPGADVLPWARRTLQNLIADPTFRRLTIGREVMSAFEPQWDTRALTATFASGDQELEARHSEQRLRAALSRLTPARRAAFEYVKGDGLSCVEAAAMLGTTTLAVRIRVHQVVKALRKAVEGEDSIAVARNRLPGQSPTRAKTTTGRACPRARCGR